MQFIEDGAVPLDKLADYVEGVRQALDARGVSGVIFGHAGDGHVHVNPLIDVAAPDWRARVQRVLDNVVVLTARLGGTLSGEHGDGRLRAPLLAEMWHKDSIQAFESREEGVRSRQNFQSGREDSACRARSRSKTSSTTRLSSLCLRQARAALDNVVTRRAIQRISAVADSRIA